MESTLVCFSRAKRLTDLLLVEPISFRCTPHYGSASNPAGCDTWSITGSAWRKGTSELFIPDGLCMDILTTAEEGEGSECGGPMNQNHNTNAPKVTMAIIPQL